MSWTSCAVCCCALCYCSFKGWARSHFSLKPSTSCKTGLHKENQCLTNATCSWHFWQGMRQNNHLLITLTKHSALIFPAHATCVGISVIILLYGAYKTLAYNTCTYMCYRICEKGQLLCLSRTHRFLCHSVFLSVYKFSNVHNLSPQCNILESLLKRILWYTHTSKIIFCSKSDHI